jgi:hypothetical protein
MCSWLPRRESAPSGMGETVPEGQPRPAVVPESRSKVYGGLAEGAVSKRGRRSGANHAAFTQ